jgi:signal transduction histidine kinase
MKLRAELAEEGADKEKLQHDLAEIEQLVREGIAYARSAHGTAEKLSRMDVDSFLQSLVYDYQDVGSAVTLTGKANAQIVSKPHALRRILGNLIDNALKFGGTAAVSLQAGGDKAILITVTDNGPGIPEDELQAVLQPFYRLERSRNRDTGGTGLGLAIAHQLAMALGGSLTLSNHPDGGLVATVQLTSAGDDGN